MHAQLSRAAKFCRRCLLLGRVDLVRGGAGYSHQTSLERFVGRSVCIVHCGKTADQIQMPIGIIGRTGPGMRQVVGFGDRSTGRGTLGANLGRVCYSASTWPSCQITLGSECVGFNVPLDTL